MQGTCTWSRKRYFFCGIGGSGMMPLALLLKKRGAFVCGSDRSYDQGKTPEKFSVLQSQGIELYPQDGSGVNAEFDYLVVSSAVEETIPDVKSALHENIEIIKRGALLAGLFNDAKYGVAVAGTSGKSTVTGMLGVILNNLGLDPTVVNGGAVRDFVPQGEAFHVGLASIRAGSSEYFVSEMDESDGSIAAYTPCIGVLNNIALDHKTMEELEVLFGDYIEKCSNGAVANFDNLRVKKLVSQKATLRYISYSLHDLDADLYAYDLTPHRSGISFKLRVQGNEYLVQLQLFGRHNVENALSALGACVLLGLDIERSIAALSGFSGIHRRMEFIGSANDIAVYDDFGHNPDKISASLESLKAFDGRLIVMFQAHGFGPLRLMGKEIVSAFAAHLSADDLLLMPEVYYAGGTVDRSVTAADIIEQCKNKGVDAHWFEARSEIAEFIFANARSGDRVVIMGARDDTLHEFAHAVLSKISR